MTMFDLDRLEQLDDGLRTTLRLDRACTVPTDELLERAEQARTRFREINSVVTKYCAELRQE